MDLKKYGEDLYESCRNVQGNLYYQIERVEHSMNLVRMAKPKGLDIIRTNTYREKINALLFAMNEYKTELLAHANFVDVKLSVLGKEIKKPNYTEQSLNEISSKMYDGAKTIEMPSDIKNALAKFNIVFDEKDIVKLTTNISKDASLSL